jgi:hypothetical protein
MYTHINLTKVNLKIKKSLYFKPTVGIRTKLSKIRKELEKKINSIFLTILVV